MEYVNGGELFFHLSREKKFSEAKAKFYAAEICCAIGFLHKQNIIYRDIKLENILLDSQGHIKLTDFGLCKMNIGFNCTTETFCGTLEYLAPEIVSKDINGSRGYTRAVDWWAVGVVLYEMMVGRLPFSVKSSNDHQNLFEKICKDDIYLPDELSVESKLIINQLLEKQPPKRLGSSANDFEDIKSHVFFNEIDWKKLVEKQIEPPFIPIINSDADTSYFAKEFTGELVQLTPPTRENYFLNIHGSLNYFDSFSYYGSKTSLNSQKSNSSMRLPGQVHTNTLIHVDQFDIELILNQSPAHSVSERYSNRAYGSILEEEENKSVFTDLASSAFPGLIQFQHEKFSLKQFYSTQKRDDLNERFSFTSSSTDCSVRSSSSNKFSMNGINQTSQSSYENEITDMEIN
jgi:serine/threonine protein kinase